MLYFVDASKNDKESITSLIKQNPQIKFVSLAAVDLGNNHTDEKIVISKLIDDYDNFMKRGIQTDGSSVFLPLIADINNAQVSLIPDKEVKWFVDYNNDHIDEETGRPIGTLMIPSFISHNGSLVCSRSILKRAKKTFEKDMAEYINNSPEMIKSIKLEQGEKISKAEITAATELEFWVKSPEKTPDRRSLMTSQTLKEQYWKRTVGNVRTALEKTILLLDDYGLEPEMGHKEVGGVSAKLNSMGDYDYVYEQLELDWKYDDIIQSADNEMFARDIIKDVFVRNGLHVTFKPKPIDGAAGSGEHHHIGVLLTTNKGRKVNAFDPKGSKEDYLSGVGYASMMGLLGNYEIVSPFVTASNNAFRRLIPGFEAPVSIVSSFGHEPDVPARNRTVLVDLIRELDNEFACRFELRAPNPLSNSFLLMSATLMAMLDGVKYAQSNSKTQRDLRIEIMKKKGEFYGYLKKEREYITDKDIFDYYTEEERQGLYGKPPRTVYDSIKLMDENSDKWEILERDGVFTKEIIASYRATIFSQWINELEYRIIKNTKLHLKKMNKLHSNDREITTLCRSLWNNIEGIKEKLISDVNSKAYISEIEEAIHDKDYEKVNMMQIEISELYTEIEDYYSRYTMSL